MDEKKPYGLYVVLPQDISESETRYIITPDWCLLYTQNEPPERNEEVTNLQQLPALAKEWLEAQIEDIRKKYLAEQKQEVLKKAKDFTQRFAEELAKEQERVNKEANNDAATEP